MTELFRNHGDIPAQPGKALSASVGVASPLWIMFTGAATAGIAYWWMTRWLKPTNLEALHGEAAATERLALSQTVDLATPDEVPPPVENLERPILDPAPMLAKATVEATPAEAAVEATEALADSESVDLATPDEVPPPVENLEPPILEAQTPPVAKAKPKVAKKATSANGVHPPVEPS